MSLYQVQLIESNIVGWTEGGHGISKRKSKIYAKSLLENQEFVRETISKIEGYDYEGPLKKTEISLFQHGAINTVWDVTTYDGLGNHWNYFVILSRSTEEYNDDTKNDFQSLDEIISKGRRKGIADLCAYPYYFTSVEGTEGELYGFSVERLNKVEVNAMFYPQAITKIILPDGVKYIPIGALSFYYNTNDRRAALQHELLARPAGIYDITEDLIMRIAQKMLGGGNPSDFFNDVLEEINLEVVNKNKIDFSLAKLNSYMTSQMAYSLRMVHLLTGKVPRKFSVNSGDFVATPVLEGDLELQLITIRGGLRELPDEHFFDWLRSREESTLPSGMEDYMSAGFMHAPKAAKAIPEYMPIFVNDSSLQEGIKRAEREFGH